MTRPTMDAKDVLVLRIPLHDVLRGELGLWAFLVIRDGRYDSAHFSGAAASDRGQELAKQHDVALWLSEGDQLGELGVSLDCPIPQQDGSR